MEGAGLQSEKEIMQERNTDRHALAGSASVVCHRRPEMPIYPPFGKKGCVWVDQDFTPSLQEERFLWFSPQPLDTAQVM